MKIVCIRICFSLHFQILIFKLTVKKATSCAISIAHSLSLPFQCNSLLSAVVVSLSYFEHRVGLCLFLTLRCNDLFRNFNVMRGEVVCEITVIINNSKSFY